ncbi:MAG: methionyl-tRNA formyltransferase [Proteobacteria bacterium]|nr:methionyl-tRNA formyltransferase [Pseudomonadota bacterium]
MKIDKTIVFMGTPEFAIPALEALHEAGAAIPLVVTQPDRPKGRGKKCVPPPVKITAERLGYPVVQPESIRTVEFLKSIDELKPECLVVVAFGHILVKPLLDIPKMGAINVHPSLLPKYRGPAPIQHSIINGDRLTGVTTMLLDEGIDSGDMLLTETVEIRSTDTSESLHHTLAEKGARLLIRSIEGLANHTIHPICQDHERKTLAPMFKKADGRINWQDSGNRIDCFVRGMYPWPGAFTDIHDKRHKIFKVQPVELDSTELPGTVIDGGYDKLVVKAGQGAVTVLEIQSASGKRLKINDFLRGNPIKPGTLLI